MMIKELIYKHPPAAEDKSASFAHLSSDNGHLYHDRDGNTNHNEEEEEGRGRQVCDETMKTANDIVHRFSSTRKG